MCVRYLAERWGCRRGLAVAAPVRLPVPHACSPHHRLGGRLRRETMTEVELVSGGLAVSLPGDRPAMLRGLSLRHDGPAVLIVDEASRVRDELWATISPMLAAAPAAQQILLSTPAGASGEFPPRLVLRRRLGACADHRRSMSTHLSRASRRRAHSPGRCSLPPGVFRCLRVGAGQRLRRRGAGAHVWRSCRG